MNEPENNYNGDNLDDFLQRKKQGRLEDDFEREAAEGFSLLGGDEEARELKAATDHRVEPLFTYTRRKRAVTWSMAAGIAFIVSLTIYFLRDEVSPDRMRVADTGISKKEEVLSNPPVQSQGPELDKPGAQKPVAETRVKPSPVPIHETKKEPAEAAPPAKLSDESLAFTAAEGDKAPEVAGAGMVEKQEEDKAREMAGAGERAATVSYDAEKTDKDTKAQPAARAGAKQEKETSSLSTRKKAKFAAPPTEQPSAPQMAGADFDMAHDDAGVQLRTILRKKLSPELQKPFKAIVTIKSGKAKTVRFTEGDLSKSDKKEIEETIHSLVPEEVHATGISDGDIKLDYRP